jgi:hypothetical protein
MRNEYKIIAGKDKRKNPLGRHWRRCEDNIKRNLKKYGMRCGL